MGGGGKAWLEHKYLSWYNKILRNSPLIWNRSTSAFKGNIEKVSTPPLRLILFPFLCSSSRDVSHSLEHILILLIRQVIREAPISNARAAELGSALALYEIKPRVNRTAQRPVANSSGARDSPETRAPLNQDKKTYPKVCRRQDSFKNNRYLLTLSASSFEDAMFFENRPPRPHSEQLHPLLARDLTSPTFLTCISRGY